jgi:hypothetical protein
MPSHGAARALIHNFLGTYTSRNSDHKGYWVLGFVAAGLVYAEWDLLSQDASSADDPIAAARHLAFARFTEQASKAGLRDVISRARMCIRGGEARTVPPPRAGAMARGGYEMSFTVEVETPRGTERGRVAMTIAPHDPALESRSTR